MEPFFTNNAIDNANLDGGFFGTVKSTATDYIKTLGSEILPNWTANQLGMQSRDMLRNPTFDARTAPPRVSTPDVDESGFLADTINVGEGGLVMIGLVFLATILVLKKF